MGVVIQELEVVEQGPEGQARPASAGGARTGGGAAGSAGGGRKPDAAEELRRALRQLAERRARTVAH